MTEGLYGQELVKAEPTPMQLIQQAIEHGISPDQMSVLMDLQERHARNKAEREYGEAVAAFQARCPTIHKSRAAAFNGKQAYTYASLDDIMVVIRPILQECGLSVAFTTTLTEGMITAECILRHGIHSERHGVTLPMPGDMRVNDTQKAGAALSYAKRYALCAALNLVVTDEDDDAGGLGETITEEDAIKITEMLEALGGDNYRRFLEWLEVDEIRKIPASRLTEVIGKLKGKLREAGK